MQWIQFIQTNIKNDFPLKERKNVKKKKKVMK